MKFKRLLWKTRPCITRILTTKCIRATPTDCEIDRLCLHLVLVSVPTSVKQKLPSSRFNWLSDLLLTTLSVSFLASLWPAFLALRLQPMDVLREQ